MESKKISCYFHIGHYSGNFYITSLGLYDEGIFIKAGIMHLYDFKIVSRIGKYKSTDYHKKRHTLLTRCIMAADLMTRPTEEVNEKYLINGFAEICDLQKGNFYNIYYGDNLMLENAEYLKIDSVEFPPPDKFFTNEFYVFKKDFFEIYVLKCPRSCFRIDIVPNK
jgi:hypothetical protein